MIAELYLIMDLLKDTVGDTPISPPSTRPQAVKMLWEPLICSQVGQKLWEI